MNTEIVRPIFSVVIPVYNVSNYICECLDSVVGQTFKSFEVICVDDESPDDSVKKIKSYTDPRIRVISQKNRGLAGARNTGINASRGVFVALLDADDVWHPEKLESHFYHLQSNSKIGVSYCASEFIDENSNQLGIGQYPKLTDIKPEDVFCRNPVGNGSAAVLRKSMLLNVSRLIEDDGEHRRVFFDERLKQSEDVDFWLRIALTSKFKFSGISSALTYYRVNASGLSANLQAQYQAWLSSVSKNKELNPEFFSEWFSLASAYQKRYLSRRAVKNGDSKTALRLVNSALNDDIRILFQEPLRTSVTYACALFSLLPKPMFEVLFNWGMGNSFLRSKA